MRLDHKPLLGASSDAEKKQFLKDCHVTLKFASQVESWLKGWFLSSIIPMVNSMAINLKMSSMTRKHNSCIVTGPRGCGKCEYLEKILAASNPKHFVILPAKMFESLLLAKGRDYFHNKIMVDEDLIVTFQGMSKKQRQQLNGFWVLTLQGRYGREGQLLEDVSTIALFGLASEELDRFRGELMSTTFLDRVPLFKHNVSTEMEREILRFRRKRRRENPAPEPPVIKLPLPEKIEDDKKVDVAFPNSDEIDEKVEEYAMELKNYQVQSIARGQDYIITFMRANALLNDRTKVTKSDLLLYDLVHPLFLNSIGELGTENRILSVLKNNPDLSDKELMKKACVSKTTFYRIRKMLQGKEMM